MENNIVKEIYDLKHLIHCYASEGYDLKKHMNVSQFQVMMYLFRHEKDDVCQKDLESEIHLTKASITGCLDSLEDMGFVTGALVSVISEVNGSLIVNIKNSKVALDKQLASKIMI